MTHFLGYDESDFHYNQGNVSYYDVSINVSVDFSDNVITARNNAWNLNYCQFSGTVYIEHLHISIYYEAFDFSFF